MKLLICPQDVTIDMCTVFQGDVVQREGSVALEARGTIVGNRAIFWVTPYAGAV
jgi:hypothetical protein